MGMSDNGTVQHVTLARATMNHEPPSSALFPLARFLATSREEEPDGETFFNARDISYLLQRMPSASRYEDTGTCCLVVPPSFESGHLNTGKLLHVRSDLALLLCEVAAYSHAPSCHLSRSSDK
ncbi:hypothetical protein GQ607_006127 [Colletotrichum asianum]|uniref:Uncharacterized protein n=1 Tax=Colletotrichum asianum TaxID=702518 RepID=A0A8H3WGF7_9PEZI|nr:hypothetical protein GQ607_006127 [Colletotrichum asianum]